MTGLLIFPILVPMVSAIATWFLRAHHRHAAIVSTVGAVIHLAFAGLLLSAVMTQGVVVHRVGNWPAPAGICLVADLLSAVLVLITAILHVAVSVYTRSDTTPEQIRAGFHPFMQMLTAAICGAFLTGDLFNLYVWFEVMLMASFGLMVMENPAGRLPNAVKYVTLNIVATLFLLTGIGLVYGLTGTLNLADLHGKTALVENTGLLAGTSLLLMIAFGIKSALFPLFFWLPAAYHTLPPGVAAFFGGLLTKVGVYALIRLFTLVFVTQTHITHTILMIAAGLTMLSGVITAASQMDIRRILSFHIISQVGYMVLGLAVFTPLALAAAVIYMVHNILAKATLFLVGGLIQRAAGSFHLTQIGSLYKTHGLLSIGFFIPAFALSGFPPLSGFWAKLLIIYACLQSHHFGAAALAALVGLLTLFSMVKIWMEAFWKPSPQDRDASQAPPLSPWMMTPVLCLCLMIVLMGLFIEPILQLSLTAGEQLIHPAAYVAAVKGGG
ncbi:MAG: proton-conducting transporter membrane subunit [Desulfotignum sp.]|nr:proton-conducting transporter membrane subunit [Desulfotignum sp.]